MSASRSAHELLQCSLIICVKIDLVCKFFETLFDCSNKQIKDVPCRYACLQLSPRASVILVESGSCDEEMRVAFGSVGVRQLFIRDGNIQELQNRALAMGALVNDGDMCVVEGPESIVIHILSGQVQNKTVPQAIMKTLLDRLEHEEPVEAPGEGKGGKRESVRPSIRTVDVSVQSDGQPLGITPCPANHRVATPFETELFKGTAMMMVRTDPQDEKFREFFDNGKKRTFEVQVQGMFKRMPVGEIYVGADVTNKMELGIITRSFSRAVLKFINTMVNDLHYSFGDSPGTSGFEKPHIVAPLFTTMDKIVETPAGQEPPPMGKPFPEDPEYRKIRMKTKVTNDMINLGSTYSFSVNTSNMDLVTWNLVGIPMMKALDMRTFFGESPIRLVGYEMPADEAAKHPNKHPAAALNYVFNMQLTRMDTAEGDSDSSSSDMESGAEEDMAEIPTPVMLLDAIAEDQGQETADTKSSDDEKNEDGIEDNKRGRRRLPWRRSGGSSEPAETKGRRSKKLGRWLRREVGEFFHRDKDSSQHASTHSSPPPSNRASLHSAPVDDSDPVRPEESCMESDADLRYCPACIDAIDHRKEGKRRTLFAFPWVPRALEWVDPSSPGQLSKSPIVASQLLSARSSAPCEGSSVLCTPGAPKVAPYLIKLRSHSDFVRTFPVAKVSKILKVKRLTTVERERRQLAEIYSLMLTKGASYTSVMDAFFGVPSDSDKSFLSVSLSKSSGGSGNSKKITGDEMWEGSVAFATDRRHWVEGVAFLTHTEITICRSSDMRKVVLTIPIASIICMRAMLPEEVPMDMFGFFQIETFSRVLYFMVRSQRQLDGWLAAFTAVGITALPNYSEMSLSKLVEDLYFGMSTSWRLDKKRLFNYRNIIFRRTGLSAEFSGVSVAHLAEGLLEKVFSLVKDEGLADVRQWIQFMNWASALQAYDLYALEGVEKVAVLLNVFHAMLLHGMIILGPPVSWSSWPSFFNFFSYIISYEYICLSEFEYNILRAAMAKPSAILSKIRVPRFGFPGLALTERDFRFNFCINNGSLSMSSIIPVYYGATLDRQLDEVTAQMLSETARVEVERKFVTLPRVCSWFLADFDGSGEGHAVPSDCLRILAPYLKDIDRLALMRMMQDGVSPSILLHNQGDNSQYS